MFNPYESKPVTRMAVQIDDEVYQVGESTYSFKGVTFKAYTTPLRGDWVVKLTEEDTYHCTDDVFRKRNIVP